jgi:hypothetical protein
MESRAGASQGFARTVRDAVEDAVAGIRARRRKRRPRITELGARRIEGLTAQELMYRFESLGDNCEFGLVQRRCGAEPLGLFRFAGIGPHQLARALEADLDDIADPDALKLSLEESGGDRREFVAHQLNYDMKFHIGFSEDQGTAEKFHGQIVQRLRFFRRKLCEALTAGEKILVCRTRDGDEAVILRIGAALRRFGPNLLLWVTPAAEPASVGRVELVSEGVLKGHIERDSDWDSLRLETWLCLCEQAHALWRPPESRT